MKARWIFEGVSTVTLVLALGILVVIGMWLRPVPVLTIVRPIHVTGTVYSAGNLLEYEFAYCKFQDIDAEVSYAFIDSITYSTPGVSMHELAVGCHTSIESLEVPMLPTGIYRLEMTRVYTPNPLRRVQLHSVSNPFTVQGLCPDRKKR